MAQIDGEIAASMNRVRVLPAPRGSLRLIMPVWPPINIPVSTNPNGVAEAQSTYAAFHSDIDASHLAALRKANIFAPIRVTTGQVSVADNEGADFALWFANNTWHLRYRDGDTSDLADIFDAALWANAVDNLATRAMQEDTSGLIYHAHYQGTNNPRFHLGKTDYFSAADMAPALKSAWLHAAAEVQPVAHPIGGRVKIVIPANPNLTMAHIEAITKVHNEQALEAYKVFYEATTAGYVDAIRRSHMFAKVDVVTLDATDVPTDGYDVTIWRPAAVPFSWSFRVAGQNDARTFATSPGESQGLQKWVEALDTQLLASH